MFIPRKSVSAALALSALIVLAWAPLTGCENLPGDRGTQGAVIGGASGAVIGAVLAKNNRLLGALIGGALGAGGGYLIGAKTDWFGKDKNEVKSRASDSVTNAQKHPATVEQAKTARTADINNDGFVTLDEVVALEHAGLSDSQIIDRLEATGQIFDLNEEQKQILLDNGVSQKVITRMVRINQEDRERFLSSGSDAVISHDPKRS